PVRPVAGPAPVLASSVPLAPPRHLPALVHHLLHQLHHPHHLHHVLPGTSLARRRLPGPAVAQHLHHLHHPHHLHHVLHLPAPSLRGASLAHPPSAHHLPHHPPLPHAAPPHHPHHLI